MAIQQTKKQSDLEKRLQLLRRQVYGKGSESQYISKSVNQRVKESDVLTHRPTDTLILSDLTYLRHDLLKILIFSSFAIGAQVILFFLLKNNILKINFL